ncbi:MAG TPA: polysaccharide biosynthesis protein [Lachnospiraceae bacterium]|nr:polysaccharide biosynthesis protein [Lachnospiraceae bacterium]
MNKLKLFVENFLVYGLGGIISKVIPLVMLPIIVRLMPDSTYFGISDLSNTVISFASAVAVMGVYDAMYRMFFEKEDEEYKKTVCSTALLFTLGVSVLVFFVMLLTQNWISRFFFGGKQYTNIVCLSAIATLVGATNSIISAPTRMQNQRKIFLITNTVSPILAYAVSVPMLLMGYYVIALPLASVISGLTMEIIFGILNYRWFIPIKHDYKILKQLLVIAIPLFPNFIIYWIFNSCDKVMITNLLGIGAAGIYAIGSKLGHCSQLIYTAFVGGWQFFAFSTMKEKNQVRSNSKIFEYLGIISFIATAFICAWSHFIYKILFTSEYLDGYIVAPYLFFAPLLQMLFQVACNQFLVIKKTWPNMFILFVGAVANIIINYMLIPLLGIEGAAIGTLAGYMISTFICVVVLCKMKLMVISRKFIAASGIMMIFMIVWRLFSNQNMMISTLGAIVLSVFLIIFYRKDIVNMIHAK